MIYHQLFSSSPLNDFAESIYYLKGNMGNSEKKILPVRKPDTGFVYNDFNRTVEPVRSRGIIPFVSYKVGV
jgi:hypothetical protein